MKRAAMGLIALIMLFTVTSPSAAVDDSSDTVSPSGQSAAFYCAYVPKSERSAIFYLDVYSTVEVSAALMDLRFDDGFVDYREVSAVEQTSYVRAVCSGGSVKIVFADSGAVKGKLCRVTFKTVQTGTAGFTLHISQAADGSAELLETAPEHSVRVTLGKDDAAVSASSDLSVKSPSKSTRSYANDRDENDPEDAEGDGARRPDTALDLRNDRHFAYIMIGAGVVLSAAALTAVGVILGRRSVKKKKTDAAGADEPASVHDDEPGAGQEHES